MGADQGVGYGMFPAESYHELPIGKKRLRSFVYRLDHCPWTLGYRLRFREGVDTDASIISLGANLEPGR